MGVTEGPTRDAFTRHQQGGAPPHPGETQPTPGLPPARLHVWRQRGQQRLQGQACRAIKLVADAQVAH